MNVTSAPQCTIAIPVYNQIRFFDKALASVLAQAWPGLEVLVVDDGSRPEVFASLERRLASEARVRLVRNPNNLGLFPNWNECLRLAAGRSFGILCADDELVPGYLRHACDVLDSLPDVALVSTQGVTQDSAGQELGRLGHFFAPGVYAGPPSIAVLLDFYARTGHNPFNYPSGVLVRTSTARAIGGFDNGMRHVGDLDFFFRLMARGHLAYQAAVGCRVTLHAEQTGAIQAAEPIGMREMLQIVDKQDDALLTPAAKAELRRQVRALGLVHAARHLVLKRRVDSCRNYWRFARGGAAAESAPLALLGGGLSIVQGKLDTHFGQGRWQRRLDRHRAN